MGKKRRKNQKKINRSRTLQTRRSTNTLAMVAGESAREQVTVQAPVADAGSILTAAAQLREGIDGVAHSVEYWNTYMRDQRGEERAGRRLPSRFGPLRA